MSLYLGCPVWSFKGWVGNFYPKGTKSTDFLREYARRLTTIEGNTTFYAVPAPKTIEAWAEQTPETFRFLPEDSKGDQPQRETGGLCRPCPPICGDHAPARFASWTDVPAAATQLFPKADR
ncbi:DUF72 domain-containing protein [Candidatus Villigracilis affinis]|uniref:DUF72 domain-containing protein n=1 Tax=Candidatus Villigracilis affinis TaxID=3140682 RepID=UPI0031EBD8AB